MIEGEQAERFTGCKLPERHVKLEQLDTPFSDETLVDAFLSGVYQTLWTTRNIEGHEAVRIQISPIDPVEHGAKVINGSIIFTQAEPWIIPFENTTGILLQSGKSAFKTRWPLELNVWGGEGNTDLLDIDAAIEFPHYGIKLIGEPDTSDHPIAPENHFLHFTGQRDQEAHSILLPRQSDIITNLQIKFLTRSKPLTSNE